MRRYYVLAIALLVAAVLAGQFRSSAQNSTSATFTVNSLSDTPDAFLADSICADASGACTLRAAIQQANSDAVDDTINFAMAGTVQLTSVLPDLLTNVTINGPAVGQLTVRRNTDAAFRIFRVVSGVTVAISRLTISNGRAPFEGGFALGGGGILNSGRLTLTDCTISGNTTNQSVTADILSGDGGGINNSGLLTMTGCTVTNNTAADGTQSSGPSGIRGSNGGGIFNGGLLTMTDCTVIANASGKGGPGHRAGQGGGIYSHDGSELTMTRCGVTFNATGDGGDSLTVGGHGGSGGGIFTSGFVTTITDSDISQNRTGRGGSNLNGNTIFGSNQGEGGSGGGIASFGRTTITGSTINFNATGNGVDVPPGIIGRAGRGGRGGGIWNEGTNSSAPLTVNNCTISGNSTGRSGMGGIPDEFNVGGDGAGISNIGYLKLSNSTVVLNSAGLVGDSNGGRDGRGGGIYGISGNIEFRSNIIAHNITREVAGRDVTIDNFSYGYNLIGIGEGSCCFSSTDQLGTALVPLDPGIGVLASNGGFTQTHALLPGSPAIDKGLAQSVDNQPVSTDQRGFARPFDDPAIPPASGGNNSDVGAFERQTTAPIMTVVHFVAAVFDITEGCVQLDVTVKRTGPKDGTTEVTYVTNNRRASQRGDFTYASGRITFAPGEDTKTINVLISEDAYAEGTEDLDVFLVQITGGTMGLPNTARVYITDDETTDGTANPIDEAAIFVGQHYHDFLNRQADNAGQNFWTNQIASCGTDSGCLAEKRENVSAAFFLSIEFQQSGYFVIRANKAAFADQPGNPRYLAFLGETQEVGRDVVVGQAGFEARLEANKQLYAEHFVARPDFQSAHGGKNSQEYVDSLFANTGATPTQAERDAAIAAFGVGDTVGLTGALRSVIESGSVYNKLYNQAFVQLQYFGYLRRNADDLPDTDFSGYNFWLNKLNLFTGVGEDVREEAVALARVKRAEMVRAFITSGEYRGRFR